jgi:hypothetical protein
MFVLFNYLCHRISSTANRELSTNILTQSLIASLWTFAADNHTSTTPITTVIMDVAQLAANPNTRGLLLKGHRRRFVRDNIMGITKPAIR